MLHRTVIIANELEKRLSTVCNLVQTSSIFLNALAICIAVYIDGLWNPMHASFWPNIKDSREYNIPEYHMYINI